MPRRTKAEAEQTREQILEAALKVFSQKGYSKGTFVDIADEIGLTKGAVYWHFKTKPDLLAAMIAYGEELMYSSVGGTPPNSVAELRERSRAQAEAYARDDQAWNFEFFCNFQIEWSAELLSEINDKLAKLRADPITQYEQHLTHLQQIGALTKEMDTRQVALCAAASWTGAMNLALCGEYDRECLVDVLVTSFDLLIGSHATNEGNESSSRNIKRESRALIT